MEKLLQLANAVNAARIRTGNKTISLQTESGQVRIVSITYRKNKTGVISPLFVWMSIEDAIALLETL